MPLTPEARETRDRVIELLVDEAVAAALESGVVIRNMDAFRAAKVRDVANQAREHPGWLRQQADRLLGAQKRPGKLTECPHCEISFAPSDADVVRGPDGLLYCRASCADHEPFVGLADFLADNPEAAPAASFLRRYLVETKGEDRIPQRDLLAIGASDLDDDIPIAP